MFERSFIHKCLYINIYLYLYFILFYEGKALETEWRASTKALKWKTALHVWGLERRPVWLKLSKTKEVGKMIGGEEGVVVVGGNCWFYFAFGVSY